MYKSVKFSWEDFFFCFPEKGKFSHSEMPGCLSTSFSFPLSDIIHLSCFSHPHLPNWCFLGTQEENKKMAWTCDPLKIVMPLSSAFAPDASLCLLYIALLNLGCWRSPWLSLTQTSRRIWQACVGDQRDKKDIFLTH